MHYFAIAVVVFTVALVMALAGRTTARAAEPSAKPPAVAAAPPRVPAQPLARAEVVKRLQTLATSPAPKNLAPGAMCYAPQPPPPERFDYVCPTCGQKTLYARQDGDRQGNGHLDQQLQQCRRLVTQVKAAGVRLDEADFCQACRPQATEPKLTLVVTYGGEPEPLRVAGVTADDLQLLVAFFAGQDKYTAGPAGEVALQTKLPRLRELLGIKPEPPPEKR